LQRRSRRHCVSIERPQLVGSLLSRGRIRGWRWSGGAFLPYGAVFGDGALGGGLAGRVGQQRPRAVGDPARKAGQAGHLDAAGAIGGAGPDRVVEVDEEARQLWQDLGDDRSTAEACYGLATLALIGGDAARAATLFGTRLALSHHVDDKMIVADALEGLAGVAARRDEAGRAAQLLGTAGALQECIEAPVAAHRRAAHAETVASTRAGLDVAAFGAAWESGQSWSLVQAVTEAMALAETLAGASF
jgi:hypothetical protein